MVLYGGRGFVTDSYGAEWVRYLDPSGTGSLRLKPRASMCAEPWDIVDLLSLEQIPLSVPRILLKHLSPTSDLRCNGFEGRRLIRMFMIDG